MGGRSEARRLKGYKSRTDDQYLKRQGYNLTLLVQNIYLKIIWKKRQKKSLRYVKPCYLGKNLFKYISFFF